MPLLAALPAPLPGRECSKTSNLVHRRFAHGHMRCGGVVVKCSGPGRSVLGGEFAQRFRIEDGDPQQRLCGARRIAPALFPILQGPHAHPQQLRKIRLRQADAIARFADMRRLPPDGPGGRDSLFHNSINGMDGAGLPANRIQAGGRTVGDGGVAQDYTALPYVAGRAPEPGRLAARNPAHRRELRKNSDIADRRGPLFWSHWSLHLRGG